MKQYVCGICGYIHDEAVGGKWEDLPADWKCPVCKAGKDAFKPKEEKTASQEVLEKPHVDKELSPMEMSIICSNLARGCEKQYLPQQADDFRKLAEFFRSKAAVPVPKPVHPLQSLWFQKNCRRRSRKKKKLSKHFVA